MQRVAARVGVTTMALYRYVATKDDLRVRSRRCPRRANRRVSLRQTRGGGRPPSAGPEVSLESLRRHPWVARVPIKEPPIGPNQVAWMERCLNCVAGSGLPPLGQLGVLNLIRDFVLGRFRACMTSWLAVPRREDSISREPSGDMRSLISTVIEPTRFPRARAAFAAVADLATTDAVWEDFEFGLTTLLDGIEAMLLLREGQG